MNTQRLEQILAALAALSAEVQAAIAEDQPIPEAPGIDWDSVEFGADGWSKVPGIRGGYLAAGIVDLREQLTGIAAGPDETQAERASVLLEHDYLNSHAMTQLSPERWAQLRTEHPEAYIDHYQNVVLGRLIILGGGSRPKDADNTLTIPQALDYSAIGAGHVGMLAGVLKDPDSGSAYEYATKIAQWAADVIKNGWPDLDTGGPLPSATDLPEGKGRINPVVYLSEPGLKRRTGFIWSEIFGAFLTKNRQARIGLRPGQFVAIPFTPQRPTEITVSADGMPVDLSISQAAGDFDDPTTVTRGSGTWEAAEAGAAHYLNIRPRLKANQPGGWVLVTVR